MSIATAVPAAGWPPATATNNEPPNAPSPRSHRGPENRARYTYIRPDAPEAGRARPRSVLGDRDTVIGAPEEKRHRPQFQRLCLAAARGSIGPRSASVAPLWDGRYRMAVGKC